MNRLDRDYINLLQDILDNGVQKGDRTGTGTLSVFGRQIRHKMSDGFPLLTTKKMAWKSIVTELLWFLRGDTNIKFLVDNDCHIWDGDVYKNYLKHTISGVEGGLDRIAGYMDGCLVEFDGRYEHFSTNPSFAYGFRPYTQEEFINKIKTDDGFAKKWGELGPIYGKQWRSWGNEEEYHNGIEYVWHGPHDQIKTLIEDLRKNPDSRRLMVNAWNVGELDQMVLPPCHYGFQVYTRELSHKERSDLKNSPPYKYGKPANGRLIDERLLDSNNVPTRAISLMWNQRSVDTFLGLPFNIASYGLLLEIIAKAVNMVPDELIGNLGDVHLYSNHIEQAKEQIGRNYSVAERLEQLYAKNPAFDADKVFGIAKDIESFCHYQIDDYQIPRRTREPYSLPTLKHMKTDTFYKSLSEDISLVTHLDNTDFEIENYQSHPAIKAPLSN